jgi:hypothetical protein
MYKTWPRHFQNTKMKSWYAYGLPLDIFRKVFLVESLKLMEPNNSGCVLHMWLPNFTNIEYNL